MPFAYTTNLNAVVQALTDANTTTASPYLSTGLTRKVVTVRSGDPELESLQPRDLPMVLVRVNRKDEEAAGLGETGPTGVRKFASVVYDIFGIYLREGVYGLERSHRTEIYALASNIEGVFQKEMQLSNTALWCHPASSEFQTFQNEGEAVKGVLISLQARYLFR